MTSDSLLNKLNHLERKGWRRKSRFLIFRVKECWNAQREWRMKNLAAQPLFFFISFSWGNTIAFLRKMEINQPADWDEQQNFCSSMCLTSRPINHDPALISSWAYVRRTNLKKQQYNVRPVLLACVAAFYMLLLTRGVTAERTYLFTETYWTKALEIA